MSQFVGGLLMLCSIYHSSSFLYWNEDFCKDLLNSTVGQDH